MIVETNELEERLSEINTHIPIIKQKVKDLIRSCKLNCDEARKDILLSINQMLPINSDEEKTKEYISKILKT